MQLVRDDRAGLALLWRSGVVGAALLLAIQVGPVSAQENEDCLMCHEDPDLVGQQGDFEISVFVDPEAFAASVHADFSCIDCHGDLDGVELPHEEDVEAVDCTMCHDDQVESYEKGIHGQRARRGDRNAPGCADCHGADYAGAAVPGSLPAPNLTPAGSLVNWSEEDFLTAMRSGFTPDSRQLDSDEMPWPTYSQMTDEELKAVWLFLQELPPTQTE